ncbi:MAG: ATP-binding protein, partial [Ruminiclostridium sp.]|nr:ATP-binding protein [Ruminiclostridium sp.]
ISFRLSAKNKKITFRTENTAQNVEKGDHPELFDRFRRGDASHNGAIPGFGIGLSMAQSITEAPNGTIEAFSRDGKSLTITVKL